MNEQIIEIDGCLGDGASIKDFILDEGTLDWLPELFQKDEIRYEYNQGNQDWSTVSCTIFWAMWAVSDLVNEEFSLDLIKELDETSYEQWRIRWRWWYTNNAANCIRKFFNNNSKFVWKYGKIAYYRIEIDNDELVKKVLDKGYDIYTGFYWNSKYTKDHRTDAKLDWTDFGEGTYWHAICIVKKDGKYRIKDNYKWRRTYDWKKEDNYYQLMHNTSEINTFHTYWYVFTLVNEDNYNELKRLSDIKTLCNNIIDLLWQLWHKVNDTNFQSILHYTANKLRLKIKDCEEEEKKFS